MHIALFPLAHLRGLLWLCLNVAPLENPYLDQMQLGGWPYVWVPRVIGPGNPACAYEAMC